MMELKVSAKKPANFYTRAAATFLRGTADKPAVDEFTIVGLGNAVGLAAAVATELERENIGMIAGTTTGYEGMDRGMVPRIAIHVKKSNPIAILLHLEIKKECVDEFKEIMTAAAVSSRLEDGCIRYDFIQDQADPCKFFTYEVFRSAEAMDIHKEKPYIKAWGAFQYGDKKPVVNKQLMKADLLKLQSGKGRPASSTAVAIVLQAELKEEHAEEFVDIIKKDCVGTRHEKGCLRFDFLQDKENPRKFATVEVFASADDIAVHGQMSYVKAWGAFQYGDKKPLVNKTVTKNTVVSYTSA